MTKMEYVVDMQGFNEPINKFVCKEISVLCIQDLYCATHLLEPPYSWSSLPAKYKSTNLWLTRNYHGLDWNNGYFPYNFLQDWFDFAFKQASIIYVKG